MVRHWAKLVVVGMLVFGAGTGPSAAEEGFVDLFNGKDLKGFKIFPANATDLFTVKDGALVTSGRPAGYVYTDGSYKNYVLKWEWRYNAPAGGETVNSGCLLHITGDHKIWPKSIEAQGMFRDMGIIIPVAMAPTKDVKNDKEAIKKARKPLGEWNAMEAEVNNGHVTIKLNGTVVATCTTELTGGPIGWQAEGAEIHLRNLRIKELK